MKGELQLWRRDKTQWKAAHHLSNSPFASEQFLLNLWKFLLACHIPG